MSIASSRVSIPEPGGDPLVEQRDLLVDLAELAGHQQHVVLDQGTVSLDVVELAVDESDFGGDPRTDELRLRVEEAAGELVGPGVGREDEVRGGQAAQGGDGVVAEAGGETGDDADECGDEHHDGSHEREAPSGGTQLQQSEEHGGSLRGRFRDGASLT